jgi:hypothetical protein
MLRKIILSVLAVAALLIIGLAIAIAMQPNTFHIERSATMAAPPETVFAQVNDFHKWEAWSPWLKADPNAKTTYEGPAQGEGAIYRWAGNAEVGEGSVTIAESRPPEYVRIRLHFLKPFEDTAVTEFSLKPDGDKTTVTWSMDGQNNFMSKAFGLLVMDMEAMIGGKYEEGLASMKQIVEAAPVEVAGDAPAATPVETSSEPLPEKPE